MRVAQLEDVVGQVGQVMNIFQDQVVKNSTSLPQSKLVQSISLLQEEIEVHLKSADKSAGAAGPSGTGRGGEFQGKITRVLSGPSGSNHTHSSSTESLSTSSPSQDVPSLTSDFWRLFFGSTNPLLPPIRDTSPQHDDHNDAFLSPATYSLNSNNSNPTIEYTITPFTQKIFRTCAESGHRYLTNSTVTDTQMWPEFGLLLEYLPRWEIISYFERVLSANPCNPVKDRRFPFISLGGAGTYFPAGSGERGILNLLPFQETNGVRTVPIEEQWFDAKDIEGFLVENGIRVAGVNDSASYYTGEVGEEPSCVMSGQIVPSKMVAVLDESTFINGLSRLCICLGCVPGFRRHDVENLMWQNLRWTLG